MMVRLLATLRDGSNHTRLPGLRAGLRWAGNWKLANEACVTHTVNPAGGVGGGPRVGRRRAALERIRLAGRMGAVFRVQRLGGADSNCGRSQACSWGGARVQRGEESLGSRRASACTIEVVPMDASEQGRAEQPSQMLGGVGRGWRVDVDRTQTQTDADADAERQQQTRVRTVYIVKPGPAPGPALSYGSQSGCRRGSSL